MKFSQSILLLALASFLFMTGANAASALQLQTDSKTALERLYTANPKARDLGQKAYAILIFPTVVKFGVVMVGGQRGDGVLWEKVRWPATTTQPRLLTAPRSGGSRFPTPFSS